MNGTLSCSPLPLKAHGPGVDDYRPPRPARRCPRHQLLPPGPAGGRADSRPAGRHRPAATGCGKRPVSNSFWASRMRRDTGNSTSPRPETGMSTGYRLSAGPGGRKGLCLPALCVQRSPEALRLTLEVDLARIVPADRPWRWPLPRSSRRRTGRLTYWALTHPGPQPDFHRRESFQLEL